MIAKLQYNKAIAGMQFTSNAYYAASGSLERFVSVDSDLASDTRVHILTGFYINSGWSSSKYLFLDTYGYWVEGGQEIGTAVATGNGQDYVNEIIRNNKHIYENNLLCAFASKYMTEDDKYTLQELQKRLLIRNEALENNELTTQRKKSFPTEYSAFYSKLESITNAKIGALISGTAMIVIAAVVIAAVGAAAYFAYQAFAAESAEDVKFSDELTAKLVSKLTKEELAQLYEETGGIVTSARLKEKFGTIAGFGSTLFWVLGGAALLYWWQSRTKTSRKTSKKKEK